MREIKFRVWNVDTKRWNRLQTYNVMQGEIKSRFEGEQIICQYTGLKDKNGVEIYDQDYFSCHGVKALIHYSVNHARWFWGDEQFSNAIASRGEVKGNYYEN